MKGFSNFIRIIKTIGFKRVVFERLDKAPRLLRTQSGTVYNDDSPTDFYPSIVVPEYLIGKTLFIIDNDEFESLINEFVE